MTINGPNEPEITAYTPPKNWSNGLPPACWTANRTYADTKPLPAVPVPFQPPDPQRQTVLLALYGEVCSGWRTLTDVRFKLLGLLPIVSVAVLITLLSKSRGTDALSPRERTAIAILGLLMTVAVRLYDLRNNDLYNDLVGRGRQIEGELGIHTGHFRGRPDSRGWIKHDVAIGAVYKLSALAWMGAAAQPWATQLSRIWSFLCP
jgi:hypothetical protein